MLIIAAVGFTRVVSLMRDFQVQTYPLFTVYVMWHDRDKFHFLLLHKVITLAVLVIQLGLKIVNFFPRTFRINALLSIPRVYEFSEKADNSKCYDEKAIFAQ